MAIIAALETASNHYILNDHEVSSLGCPSSNFGMSRILLEF